MSFRRVDGLTEALEALLEVLALGNWAIGRLAPPPGKRIMWNATVAHHAIHGRQRESV